MDSIATVLAYLFLSLAAAPFIYYLLSLYSSWRFFRDSRRNLPRSTFTPPVSNLKPIRGFDPETYENFASFCRQDYPEYELLFGVTSSDDPVVPIIEKLARDFPGRSIRIIYGSGRGGSNDKVAKLARLVSEAQYDVVVINDSDVRVRSDYLRTVVAPLENSQVGAVTCFYESLDEKTFAEKLHTVGMLSDFFAGVLVAKQLDGIKFAIGKTIATTRDRLAEFGGYESLANRPGDDLLVGRLIAEQGYTVELLPDSVLTVSGHASFRELLDKRLRWIVVMRHMRPQGHFGLLFTHGLPWSLAAILIHPEPWVAAGYLGLYLGLRIAMLWTIGIHGLHRRSLWKRIPLIPVWDAVAFFLWVASFARNTVRWRGCDYYIRNGELVSMVSAAGEPRKAVAKFF